ncbi:MAG: hypothetical protein WC505_07160 [Patescibacteria group bacterium]
MDSSEKATSQSRFLELSPELQQFFANSLEQFDELYIFNDHGIELIVALLKQMEAATNSDEKSRLFGKANLIKLCMANNLKIVEAAARVLSGVEAGAKKINMAKAEKEAEKKFLELTERRRQAIKKVSESA